MHLVSQRKFGEIAGVSTQTICKAIKKDGELYEARVKTQVDIEHPIALAFIEDRLKYHIDKNFTLRRINGPEARNLKVKQEAASPDIAQRQRESLDALAKDIRGLSYMPLRDLVTQFGDDIRFNDWLKSLKEIESIDEKRIKNAELRGKLVSREAVDVSIVGVVDQLFRQVLQDGCKNMAVKSSAMAKGGKETNEITEYLRSVITTYFTAAQRRMLNALDELEAKTKEANGRTS